MKEKSIYQKGFIPIIFVIIGAVVIASATFGVVKYKDEITASVVSIFERPRVEIPNIESTGGNKLLEESELFEEPVIEEESKEEQKTVQPVQEQSRIAEQKPQEEKPKVVDPCANVICSNCQYCLDGNCIARPDGYNDCGKGCQRCVNGSCQDYDKACFIVEHCKNDVCESALKVVKPKTEVPKLKLVEPEYSPKQIPKIIEDIKIEFPPETQGKTKGPCEGLDMRDFDWENPLCKDDPQWQKKYECQKYLEKSSQQDLENNPQLKKEYQKVQRMPIYIPFRSLPKNFGPQPF